MLTRRVTFRLYPTRQQEETLHYWRKLHCNLYNAAVYNRKTQYQKFGHSVSYFEQQVRRESRTSGLCPVIGE